MNSFLRLPAGLTLALGFLTTLPVPPVAETEFDSHPHLLGQSFAWYPFVGAVLGTLLVGVAWSLRLTPLQPPVQAGLVLLAWILLTGGLHLDGLLDACDALFAPVGWERRLEILKDVHTGAFGVIGLVLVVGLKWTLLTQILTQPGPALWAGLWLAPVWGRWMLVWAAQRYPYARTNPGPAPATLGGFMRQGLGNRQLLIASVITLLATGVMIVIDWRTGGVLLAPLVGLWSARWAAHRLNGGLTGDLYGALCEVTELAALLGVLLGE